MGVSAQDSERKVPPRTPMQRFNTLHRFINDWIDANVGATLKRPGRAEKMKDAFQRIFDAQTDAFQRCGFFDPNVAHGKQENVLCPLQPPRISIRWGHT